MLHIRRRYGCVLICVCLSAACAVAQNITGFEYFVDTDPGVGLATAVSVTPSSSVSNQPIAVPLTSLGSGFHNLFVRAKLSNNTWTLSATHSFFAIGPVTPLANLIAMEYFIDTDPGTGNGTAVPGITPGTQINGIGFAVNLASVSPGFHRLFVRTRSSDGTWTVTNDRTFFVIAPPVATATIIQLEYFIDTDPGPGAANSVTGVSPGVSVSNAPAAVDVSGYAPGFHTIFVRSKSQTGQWSITTARNFLIIAAPISANLVKLEYFFDNDPGYEASGTTNIAVTPPAPSVSDKLIFADVSALSQGTHTIYIRGKTSKGDWTEVNEADFVIGPPGAATIIITSQPSDTTVCSGSPAKMSVTAVGTTNLHYQWQFSNGGNFTDISDGNGYAGAASRVLAIATDATFGAGRYRCSVSGDFATAVLSDDEGLVVQACHPPEITASVESALINGTATIDLSTLISDADNNLDPTTLQISSQEGGTTTVTGLQVTLDYSGTSTTVSDVLTVSVCDLTGLCTTQQIIVHFEGDLIVYNGVSPNGDGKNDVFYIALIDVLPNAQKNHMTLYNRWGDEVFSVQDYNNADRSFTGNATNGNELPTGIYFYKIVFTSGLETRKGYLSLKR